MSSVPISENSFTANIARAKDLIVGASKILITASKNTRGDALASALALLQQLQAINKETYLVIAGANGGIDKYAFLPNFAAVSKSLNDTQALFIKIDTSKAPVAQVKYDELGSELVFTLLPKNGSLTPDLVRVEQSDARFDLIITVGVSDLSALEGLMAEEPRLLYDTSIIALDNSVENTGFGELNLVQLTKSSLAEMVHDLAQQLNPSYLNNPDLATLLLAGLICATDNFQNIKTTPDSLQFAAHLLRHGANQQQIIKMLYRTKPLPALKLWAKAIVSLKNWQDQNFALAFLEVEDFAATGATVKDVSFVIDELHHNFTSTLALGLLWQVEPAGKVCGYLEARHPETLEAVRAKFGGALKNHHLVFQKESKQVLKTLDRLATVLQSLNT